MFRSLLTSLTALSLSFTAASAATVTAYGNIDGDFTTACSEGGYTLACEDGVAEIRGGNGSASGDQEMNVRTPSGGTGFSGVNGQYDLVSGEVLDLEVAYDATLGALSLDLGGTEISVAADLSEVDTLYIRNSSRGGGSLTLTDLMLDGFSLGSVTDEGVNYIVVSDFDFSSSFSLTGLATFTFGAGDRLGSNLAAQFKFTDLVAPVPLPASLALMLAGLGILGAARARKKA